MTICAFGRARGGPEALLYEDYIRRLPWPVTVKEVAPRGGASGEDRRQQEAGRLIKAVPDGALTVLLDEAGQTLSSREFAAKIGAWQDEGIGHLAFVIAGADGAAPALRKKADYILSLGRMTWPHLLVRPMLAEQLYRAAAILGNHPYHRD